MYILISLGVMLSNKEVSAVLVYVVCELLNVGDLILIVGSFFFEVSLSVIMLLEIGIVEFLDFISRKFII